jgi:hypothetical protein
MSIELLKSILSSVMTAMAFVQMFLMFELFGRSQVRYDATTLKRIHRINGIIFILVYVIIAYFCLGYIRSSEEELSPRVTSHALLSLSVIVLLGLKISFIRVYRQFYEKVLTLGPMIALLTFGMMATAGGYYFLVTLFRGSKV